MNTAIESSSQFILDPQIASTCIALGNWPLSQVLLKNNSLYPWFILVPRKGALFDIDELSSTARYQLIDEISALSTLLKRYFKPDKVNVAYLGNIVTQLHIHIVGRFIKDELWPHGIWQADQSCVPYEPGQVHSLQHELSVLVQEKNNSWSTF